MSSHKYISRKKGRNGKWVYDYGNLYDRAKRHYGYKLRSGVDSAAKHLRTFYDSRVEPKVAGNVYKVKYGINKAKIGAYNGLRKVGNKIQDKIYGTAWRSYQDPQQYIRKTKRGGMDIYTVPKASERFAAPANTPRGTSDTLYLAKQVANKEVKKAKKRGLKRNARRAAAKTKYAANKARNKAYLAGKALGRAAASASVKARKIKSRAGVEGRAAYYKTRNRARELAAKGRRIIKLLGNQGG